MLSGLESDDDGDTLWNKATIRAKIFLWRYWWSYPDEISYLKGCEVMVNTMRLAQTNGSFLDALQFQNQKLEELKLPSSDLGWMDVHAFHSLFSQSVNSYSSIINRVMAVEVAKQTMITAIALKRYKLKYGNYPTNLNSLVPEFLPTVPPDP